jgi:hypothetical protein
MAESRESFESRVKKEIEKSGLPTEIRATYSLNNEGWTVFNEYPYLDKDENKIRALDIVANKAFVRTNSQGKANFDCYSYLECKKADKHSWVFFTQTAPAPFIWLSIDQLSYNVCNEVFNSVIEYYEESNKGVPFDGAGMSIFSRIPVRHEFLNYKIALSQQPVFGERNDFYEALMQVLKTLSDREKNSESSKEPKIKVSDIVIPIIIFDGSLFECFYEGEALQVSKIDYTRYLSHGLPSQKLPTLIDVMTADYFPTYLKMLDRGLIDRKQQDEKKA